MIIAFILNDDSESNGGARPLIAWHKASVEGRLISFDRRLKLHGNNTFQVSSIDEAAKIVQHSDYMIVDDRNAQIGMEIKKKTGIPLVIYCQIPFGLHSLGIPLGESSKFKSLKYIFSRYIPFRVLSHAYTNKLKNADIVISNSFAIHYLLTFVYGIPDRAIIQPPVDLDIFKVDPSVPKDSISVFLGREEDWNDYVVIPILEDIAKEKGLFLQFFGSNNIERSLLKNNRMIVLNEYLSDKELVKLYNRSYMTICIQKQEFFGYVPIESVSCGTYALTLYIHDSSFMKIDLQGKILHTNRINLKKDVIRLLEIEMKRSSFTRPDGLNSFSSVESFSRLEEVLNIFGEELR